MSGAVLGPEQACVTHPGVLSRRALDYCQVIFCSFVFLLTAFANVS